MNCTSGTGKLICRLNQISYTGNASLQRTNPFLSGRSLAFLALCALILISASSFANAQGVLTITPGQTIATTAGTGSYGSGASGISPTNTALANPASVAYDAAGNLYIADSNNHVIRKIDTAGNATIVAGTGDQGFSGDGGAATSALLNTPKGIAVDGNGNLYIADTQNQRIRKVSGGTITTIAGTGAFGYSGDGAQSTQAFLASPSSVAVDSNGNIYVADTDNHVVRKIAPDGRISTFAGNGQQGNSPNETVATSASLDSPSSVAVDSVLRVYIADRRNQIVRMVDTAGKISTIAGNGSFGYGGDANSATNALLAMPSGVGVDSSGNVYIADTNNNRIRQVSNGVITTIAGTDVQGFGGDAGASTGASLDSPRAVAAGSSGTIAVADQLNQRVRTISINTLSFGTQPVGSISAFQSVTLTNSGNASLQIQTVTFTGAFGLVGGSCKNLPVTLASGAACTETIAFTPLIAGPAAGSIVFSGNGLVPQSVLLSAIATPAETTTSLSSSNVSVNQSTAISFTAKVTPATTGIPTGTVGIYDSQTSLGTLTLDSSGTATYTAAGGSLSVGDHSITAKYNGDGNYLSSTSSVLTQTVLPSVGFTIDPIAPGGGGGGTGGGTGGTGGTDQSVAPGGAATYGFTIQAQNAPMTVPVVFSARGLPSGATAIFNPASIIPGLTASTFTMTVQTPKSSTTSTLSSPRLPGGLFPVASALLLLPLLGAGRIRRTAKKLPRTALLVIFAVLGCVAVTGLSGCGTKASGYFGQQPKTYTVTIVGTATTPAGSTLQDVATVTLTIQ